LRVDNELLRGFGRTRGRRLLAVAGGGLRHDRPSPLVETFR
jgi:hypothetical protein